VEPEEKQGRRPQPWPIRVLHWSLVPVLAIMAGSGLQILVAYPFLGPRGQLASWYPLQGWVPPSWLRVGMWLAGGRHWHFAFAWLLLANGILYVLYLALSGEWRRRMFLPRRDTGHALATMAHYLRLRPAPPVTGLYNGLQRLAYTGVILLALVEVLSGLVLYKPVQLAWLGWLFGGYDGARAVHSIGLVLLALFVVVHVVMVALHPRSLRDMLTGGPRS
jgi:thiosulfate reductase cytochrome b subunit